MAKIIFWCQIFWLSKMTPTKSHGGVTLDLKNMPYTFKYKLFMLLPIDSQEKPGQVINLSCLKKDRKKWDHFRSEIWSFLLSHRISNLRLKILSLGNIATLVITVAFLSPVINNLERKYLTAYKMTPPCPKWPQSKVTPPYPTFNLTK